MNKLKLKKKQARNDDYQELLSGLRQYKSYSIDYYRDSNNKLYVENYKLNTKIKEMEDEHSFSILKANVYKDLMTSYSDLMVDDFDSDLAIEFFLKHKIGVDINKKIYLEKEALDISSKLIQPIFKRYNFHNILNSILLNAKSIKVALSFSNNQVLKCEKIGKVSLKHFNDFKEILETASIEFVNNFKNEL